MTTTSKAWSAEMTAQLVTAYAATEKDNEQLSAIAKQFGKTVPAVRSKLVSLGEYQKNEAPRKVGGASSTRKIEYTRTIETMLSLPRDSMASLEKASKASLGTLVDTLIALGDKPE